MIVALPADHDVQGMLALREDILSSPVSVALERARTYTRVFRENEGAPWMVAKALAFREHLRTIPLYLRPHDRIAGSISETPGAMPVYVEIGIAENSIYVGENPERRGYLRGRVPRDILDYWRHRNLWGRARACQRTVHGRKSEWTEVAGYKLLSCQGHLSPSYGELLEVGLGGILARVRRRREGEIDPLALEFLTAAELALSGAIEWIERYAEFLAGEAGACRDTARADDLRAMSRIAAKVARRPPETFREALQLVWFCQQAVHVEGHGYSCTPDRLDQLLHPYYLADKAAGRLDDDQALRLCENLILKMRDNTVWGVEHNLTQGVCLAGSTPDGADQTNELSWLFVAAADRMSVPEPLVWIRWHPAIDQDFFDFCLETLAGSTCFPLMMSDTAVPAMFMELGVSREDAFTYVPAGCNELALPGMAYYNPAAHVGYLGALEWALTKGRGYDGRRPEDPAAPAPAELETFDDLTAAVAREIRRQVERSYVAGVETLSYQMRWGQTPFTSCFFDGGIDRARDMVEGTKYNVLSCGGIFFANMVDALAALREVVYETGQATLEQVAAACAANFVGGRPLRAKLLAAPKHGNDDPRLQGIIRLVERMRADAVGDVCRDPRDGSPFGNGHVVRSSAVRSGRATGATPDGRLAGEPLAGSVAASAGCEQKGPTAVLNSILALDVVHAWRSGYNVNLRFQPSMLTERANRDKVRAMLNAYFARGGQEMQINCVGSDTLRAAREDPDAYRDLVVRVAGFSEFFVRLDPDIQADLIARTEHA